MEGWIKGEGAYLICFVVLNFNFFFFNFLISRPKNPEKNKKLETAKLINKILE